MSKKYLSIPDAFESVTGIRPNPSSCWRWAVKYPNDRRLKSWMIGNRRLTTVQAVQDFIERRTAEATPDSDRAQAMLNEILA